MDWPGPGRGKTYPLVPCRGWGGLTCWGTSWLTERRFKAETLFERHSNAVLTLIRAILTLMNAIVMRIQGGNAVRMATGGVVGKPCKHWVLHDTFDSYEGMAASVSMSSCRSPCRNPCL